MFTVDHDYAKTPLEVEADQSVSKEVGMFIFT